MCLFLLVMDKTVMYKDHVIMVIWISLMDMLYFGHVVQDVLEVNITLMLYVIVHACQRVLVPQPQLYPL